MGDLGNISAEITVNNLPNSPVSFPTILWALHFSSFLSRTTQQKAN